jgi:hypothetical protein
MISIFSVELNLTVVCGSQTTESEPVLKSKPTVPEDMSPYLAAERIQRLYFVRVSVHVELCIAIAIEGRHDTLHLMVRCAFFI